MTASCTCPTPGAWSTRSTCAPARRGDIVWKMDPGQEKIDRNRGVALWGNLVISVIGGDGRVIATDRTPARSCGTRTCDDQPRSHAQRGAAGAQGRDHRRRLRRRRRRARLGRRARAGDRRTCSGRPIRSRRPASPAARPGRTRTMPGRPAAAPSTSPAPTIPTPTSPIGAPAIRRRNTIRPIVPATISITNSALALDAATGKIAGIHQYTPNDTMDYDETGTHILIDGKVDGEDRKLLTHAGPQRLLLRIRPPQTASSSRRPNTCRP